MFSLITTRLNASTSRSRIAVQFRSSDLTAAEALVAAVEGGVQGCFGVRGSRSRVVFERPGVLAARRRGTVPGGRATSG